MTREGLFIDLPAEMDLPPDADTLTVRVFNPNTLDWELLNGGSGGAGGGALALSEGQNNLLDWGYLVTMDGLAVLTGGGDPIATQWPCVAAQPELVLTAAGDIVRC